MPDGQEWLLASVQTVAGSLSTPSEKHAIPGNTAAKKDKFKRHCLSNIARQLRREEEPPAASQGATILLAGDLNLRTQSLKAACEDDPNGLAGLKMVGLYPGSLGLDTADRDWILSNQPLQPPGAAVARCVAWDRAHGTVFADVAAAPSPPRPPAASLGALLGGVAPEARLGELLRRLRCDALPQRHYPVASVATFKPVRPELHRQCDRCAGATTSARCTSARARSDRWLGGLWQRRHRRRTANATLIM